MNNSKNRVPELRFKGYFDDWEQRKLSEITHSFSGGTPSVGRTDYYNGSIPFIRSAELSSSNPELSITELGLKNSSAKMVKEGSLLYAMYGATSGEVGIAGVNGAINQAVLAILPKDGSSTGFIQQWLIRSKDSIVRKYLQGGQGNLSAAIIKNLVLFAPSEDEQDKIAEFLQALDDTLALHERKQSLLRKLKKEFLQVLFPANGHKVPSLRFSGYTGDWEQRKLGDLVERVTRKNSQLESTRPLTISAQAGLIDQNDFFNKQVASRDVSGYYLVKNGEFAYNKSYSKDYPWGAIKRLDLYDKGVLSTLYIVFKPTKVGSDFLAVYFDSDRWYREVALRAAEGARNHGLLNIAPSDFFDIRLTLPQSEQEQKAIADFLKSLESTVALHQRQCEKLRALKQAYLQKMFV